MKVDDEHTLQLRIPQNVIGAQIIVQVAKSRYWTGDLQVFVQITEVVESVSSGT
jgi:hypothetical protein